MFSSRRASPGFKPIKDRILKRDRETCQFCGFQAPVHQQVVNLDGNYRHNHLDNLVTACPLCAQCLFIESVGSDYYGGGTLIHLPELTQNQLNATCHVLFCAIANGTSYKNSAQTIFRAFKERSQAVRDKFGDQCDDPAVFGQLLLETDSSGERLFKVALADLRLLPSRSGFKQPITDWAAHAMKAMA